MFITLNLQRYFCSWFAVVRPSYLNRILLPNLPYIFGTLFMQGVLVCCLWFSCESALFLLFEFWMLISMGIENRTVSEVTITFSIFVLYSPSIVMSLCGFNREVTMTFYIWILNLSILWVFLIFVAALWQCHWHYSLSSSNKLLS